MKGLSICFLFILASGCSNNQRDNEPYIIEENQVDFYEPIGPYYYYEDGGYYDHDYHNDHHDHDHHEGGHDHDGGGHGGHGH